MPQTLDWLEVLLRLAVTVAAGSAIGLNRGERGKPAGLRTTVLVCLAASVAMVLANLLLGTRGKPSDSYVQLDMMRLPLGILTGMGFIGGGTILRRPDLVTGVTTAATLWLATVIGLCFGAGEIGLGLSRPPVDCRSCGALKLSNDTSRRKSGRRSSSRQLTMRPNQASWSRSCKRPISP